MEDLTGKRKRKLPACPNPLFVHWLTEWKKDAAEKGLKTQYTYGKALKTLLKYPLLLASGKECGILENIGAKICEMLDKKLEEYIELYGTTEPLPGVIDEKLCRTVQYGSKPKKARTATGKACRSGSKASHANELQRKTPKKNPQYMPKYRSGPYALILTLHVKQQDGIPWMSKRDVMIEAQPLADTSFTVPDPGSRYTAWSSMGSLITKGYVVKDGNPARYGLTEEGIALARQMSSHRYGEEEESGGIIPENATISNRENLPAYPDLANQVSNFHPSIVEKQRNKKVSSKNEGRQNTVRPVVHTLSDSDDDDETPINIPLAARLGSSPSGNAVPSSTKISSALPSVLKQFQFRFVTESGTEVMTKDAAAVTVDEVVSVGFKIKCDYDDLVASGKRYKLLPGRSCNNTVTAYVHNDDLPEVCPATDTIADRSSSTSVIRTTKSAYIPPSTAVSSKSKSAKPANFNLNNCPKTLSPNARFNGETSSALKTTNRYTRPARPAQHHSLVSDESSQNTLQSLSQDSTASCLSLSEPDFELLPGNFEIVLCIDNHEQYGKGKFNKQTLGNELQKNGILYDVRLLQVGDFLWIARPKGYRLNEDQRQELVLDYVIERKRIDDMASSIIDGRFKEQKFRLKSCGLGVPMLLVEDCPNSYCSIPHKTLMQAATNTQVIDKFQIVKTKDLKDSFSFLINMTKFLQKTYQFKMLKAHSKVALQSNNIVNNPQEREMRLMTFTDFNKSSAKVKPLSVREAFARQLVCIHGITPEKVAVILAEYPTPASLRNAYQDCDNEIEKEMLLSQLKMPKNNKRVVLPPVSKHIYRLMMPLPED